MCSSVQKRTAAIQVRVTKQEKLKLERQSRRCGLSLSGYLRRAGSGKAVTAFPSQRFRSLYQQVNSLQGTLRTRSPDQTEARPNELAGHRLSGNTGGEGTVRQARRQRSLSRLSELQAR